MKVSQHLGIIFLLIIIGVSGFYFGYKTSEAKQSQAHSEQTETEFTNSSPNPNSAQVKKVTGIFWIKTGQKPLCPKEFPIKGKFNGTANVFYTPQNKSYARVKPMICFVSEDFATKEAGFIKKF